MVLILSIESFEFFLMTLHLLDGFFQLKLKPLPMPMFLTKKTSIVKRQFFFLLMVVFGYICFAFFKSKVVSSQTIIWIPRVELNVLSF